MGNFTRNVFLSLLLVSAPALALSQVNDPSFEQVELLLDSDARSALSLSLQLQDTAQKTGLPGPLVDVLGLVMRAQNAVGNRVEALTTGQEALHIHGAAIQARVTTEDPNTGFAPDSGKISTYRSAAGFGLR